MATRKESRPEGFVVLSAADRATMARDTLRARESDLYRAHLAAVDAGQDSDLSHLEDAVKRLRAELKSVESESDEAAG